MVGALDYKELSRTDLVACSGGIVRAPRAFSGTVSCVKDDHLRPLAVEMVGDEGEDGVVAGLLVGLVAGDEVGAGEAEEADGKDDG